MKKPYKSYSEKLKDPRWQRKRLEILERDGFTCQNCGETEKTLHVHHRLYFKGVEPWDYEGNVYITLCHECHEEWELAKTRIDRMLLLIDPRAFLMLVSDRDERDNNIRLSARIMEAIALEECESMHVAGAQQAYAVMAAKAKTKVTK